MPPPQTSFPAQGVPVPPRAALDFRRPGLYHARPMSKPGKLNLWHYYAIEGASAVACGLIQTGIFFWAALRHGFTETQCLLLGAVQGLAYVLSARFGGAVSARLGYDRVLQIAMAGTALTSLLLWPVGWRWIPFVLFGIFIAFTGPLWPSAEASILHARSPLSVPRRLGLYNITWSTFGSAGFFLCGFLVDRHLDAVIWVPGLIMAAQLLFFARPARPAVAGAAAAVHVAHDDNAGLDVATKRRFMHLHWIANSIAYFLMTSFNALLPHLSERLGLSASGLIWLTSSYLFSRAASFVVFAAWEGWHYRTAWSVASILAAIASAAVMFFSTSPGLVLAACIVFGAALGLAYSGSLYYSMNYGENKGEHGGLHEAILGVGILLGPLAGAGGAKLGGAHGAALAIIAVASVLALAGMFAVRDRPVQTGTQI